MSANTELITEAKERASYMTLLAKTTSNGPGGHVAKAEAERMTRFANALEAAERERDEAWRVASAQTELERTRAEAAEAKIAAVEALHRKEPGTGVYWCSHCIDFDGPWPCATAAALQESEGE